MKTKLAIESFTVLATLALLTSMAAAEPQREYYVGANLLGPVEEDGMDHDSDVSVEGGFSVGGSPLFGHVEAGTGSMIANAGVELRMCSRGTFFVCGSGGVDAAYLKHTEELEPVLRGAFELGTEFRVRMGLDLPLATRMTPGGSTALQDAQLRIGLAYVF
jgi:hypothetical protein